MRGYDYTMSLRNRISGIRDLFSRRQRHARGEVPDVYQYTELPSKFRVQAVHIIQELTGQTNYIYDERQWWAVTCQILRKERGTFSLRPLEASAELEVLNYFIHETNVEYSLDVLELIFSRLPPIPLSLRHHDPISPDDAKAELNARFQEHGIGFQLENDKIVRVDSEFTHAAIIRPALTLLRSAGYSGPNEEFLKAHEHYRNRRYGECLNECLKAFESTMKVICDKRNWQYDPARATAATLVEKCLANGLVPAFTEGQLTSLRVLLQTGTPTARNKTSGHGQGAVPVPIPSNLAAFGLNTAAANILLLVQADKELP